MMCLSVSDTYHKISKAWVPTLFICVFMVRSFFFIFKKTDKKIKDVRKQYHSNKNYTYCGLMTDLGLDGAIR